VYEPTRRTGFLVGTATLGRRLRIDPLRFGNRDDNAAAREFGRLRARRDALSLGANDKPVAGRAAVESADEPPQVIELAGGLDLPERHGLDLADALAGEPHRPTDLLEGVRLVAADAEAQPDDLRRAGA